jgi:hypothetical protein
MRVPEKPRQRRQKQFYIASFCFGLARRLCRQAAYRFPRPSRINVLTLTPLITTSIVPDPVVRAMLLLAGHGLLMVIHRGGLVFLRLGLFSSLGLARVDGSHDLPDELRLLLCLPAAAQDGCRSDWCSFCNAPFCLDAPAIPANLLRIRFDTVRRGRLRISHVGLGKSMLFSSWAVADALESTVTIRRPRLILIGTDNFFPVFVLSRCPTRLADVYK